MVKLIRKNSNLCDHNPPTPQTDGQGFYHDALYLLNLYSQFQSLFFTVISQCIVLVITS